MSLATSSSPATFGSGGAEPYARALREPRGELVFLRDGLRGSGSMDVARWNAEADGVDLTLLRAAVGPIIDIGCGPGRMVRAAMELGISALGVDVSATAVEIATEAGLTVMHGSVFSPVPAEGFFQTALLVDGNIGIGGDVAAMLRRCHELLTADGEIVVEVHERADLERTYEARVADAHGHRSDPFPWAEIGADRLTARADAAGFALAQRWTLGGRTFCRLAKH